VPTPRAGRKSQPRGASDSSHPPRSGNLHAISPWPKMTVPSNDAAGFARDALPQNPHRAYSPPRQRIRREEYSGRRRRPEGSVLLCPVEDARQRAGVAAGSLTPHHPIHARGFRGHESPALQDRSSCLKTDRQARRAVLTSCQPRRAAIRTACRCCRTRRPPRETSHQLTVATFTIHRPYLAVPDHA
jgi:hypothetical protein